MYYDEFPLEFTAFPWSLQWQSTQSLTAGQERTSGGDDSIDLKNWRQKKESCVVSANCGEFVRQIVARASPERGLQSPALRRFQNFIESNPRIWMMYFEHMIDEVPRQNPS